MLLWRQVMLDVVYAPVTIQHMVLGSTQLEVACIPVCINSLLCMNIAKSNVVPISALG